MKLFDTHCHFETTDETEIAAILSRAKAAGVTRILAVGGSEDLNRGVELAAAVAAASDASPVVLKAIGFDRSQASLIPHPSSLPTHSTSLIPNPSSLRAIGEIGLDYHYSPETRKAQLKLFGEQLELAQKLNLPVIIHTREADDDTVALLKEIPSRGIIHCYTGTPEYAKRFLDLGFYISFSGIVTFRAADNVRSSVRVVPDDRILIETDSPFLAPVPMRGQPNEPAFIRYTCEFLANFRQMSAADFADLTFTNAEQILG